jgi:hypothetical protein
MLLLNRYHEPIRNFYRTVADRLQLMQFYLPKWKAIDIETDLIHDGVIKRRKKKRGSKAAAAAADESNESDHDDEEAETSHSHMESEDGKRARAHADEPARFSQRNNGRENDPRVDR